MLLLRVSVCATGAVTQIGRKPIATWLVASVRHVVSLPPGVEVENCVFCFEGSFYRRSCGGGGCKGGCSCVCGRRCTKQGFNSHRLAVQPRTARGDPRLWYCQHPKVWWQAARG